MENNKYLNAKEVAVLLGMPMVTVQRWAHQGKIPCWLKDEQYLFNQKEIQAWANTHHMCVEKKEPTPPSAPEEDSVSLESSLKRGGFFYQVPGNDIYDVLKNAVDVIPLPEGTDRTRVLNELLNREEIASTGIGNGVAIPHPRYLLELGLDAPAIFVVFLQQSVDFNAVDRLGVFVLFMIFSPSTHFHLKLLSRLSMCLRNESFMTLLKERASEKELLAEIQRIEKKFETVPVG